MVQVCCFLKIVLWHHTKYIYEGILKDKQIYILDFTVPKEKKTKKHATGHSLSRFTC